MADEIELVMNDAVQRVREKYFAEHPNVKPKPKPKPKPLLKRPVTQAPVRVKKERA